MTTIHITSPAGGQKKYNEQQIQSMWNEGLFAQDAHYWIDGMDDWKPIAEYFAASPNPIPAPPPLRGASDSGFTFVKEPGKVTSFLVIMLGISLVAEILFMTSDLMQMSLLSRDTYTDSEADANDMRQGIVGIGYLLVYIVTGITFLRWTHRANLNSHGFGAKDMKYTPGWSIGYYFIPFLNLVRPYQVMKEIWDVSLNPHDWDTGEKSPLLVGWWSLWLLTGFLGQATFRLSMNADTVEALQVSTVVSILSTVVAIPLCVVALYVVNTISKRQHQLVGTA